MKCPQCNHNQKVSLGTTCSSCGYKFALNPKNPHGMTDRKLLFLISKASCNDTYYFTLPQLYATLARTSGLKRGQRIVRAITGIVVIGVVIGAVIAIINGIGGDARIFFGCCSMIGLLFAYSMFKEAFTGNWGDVISYDVFKHAVDNYQLEKGSIEKLVDEPALHDPPPDWPEADIFDYGVERILIVEHDIMVDQYVLNGMHTDQRCVIVAESGYPTYIAERAGQLVEERPTLPLFLLHDPEHDGVMRKRIERNPPFPIGPTPHIVDLGLFADSVSEMPSIRNIHKHIGPPSVMHLSYDSLLMGMGLAMAQGVALSVIIEQSRGMETEVGSGSYG